MYKQQICRQGWSRAEWLVVMGCLTLLFSISVPLLWARMMTDRVEQTQRDFSRVQEAAHRFFQDYGHWPSARAGQPGDVRYGILAGNRAFFNILQARDAEGNKGHGVNTRQVQYLALEPWRSRHSGVNAEGDFLDCWGSPFQVIVDTDLDQVCRAENSIYDPLIGHGLVIWSAGPDRISDTADDLVSWEKP
jgi:hypothetical protein